MTRRPRISTLVLIGLFISVFALYIVVRPVTETTPAGNVQPTSGNPTPTVSPADTRPPASSHPPSPSPSQTHSQTPTATSTATPDTGSPAP